jgi:hypothetical protein
MSDSNSCISKRKRHFSVWLKTPIPFEPQTSKCKHAESFCLLLPICPRKRKKKKYAPAQLVFGSLQPMHNSMKTWKTNHKL